MVAPPVQHSAADDSALECTPLKERQTDGAKAHAHAHHVQAINPVPRPPHEYPLSADPLELWRSGRTEVRRLDEAQLQSFAAALDAPTGGYGRYWLGRAILAAHACDPSFATNPRALNLVRAILRRWTHEGSFGSDTRAYQSLQEQRHDTAAPSLQRLGDPRRRFADQSHQRAPRRDASRGAWSRTIAPCTIIGDDPDCDG
jgi:hypothetical protein